MPPRSARHAGFRFNHILTVELCFVNQQNHGRSSQKIRKLVSSNTCCGLKRPSDHEAYRFTLTPQRMRIIAEAFKETLELGLTKPGQVVVCIRLRTFCCPDRSSVMSNVLFHEILLLCAG